MLNKKYALMGVATIIVIIAAFVILLVLPSKSVQAQSSPQLQVRFNALSHATSDQCAYLGNKAAIYSSINSQMNGTYFQGSCCSPMDFKHYSQQIAGLKNYSNISAIPHDTPRSI